MRVQIRPRGPSSVKLKFMPGLPGPQGIPGDITPEFLVLAAEINADASYASAAAGTATTMAGEATGAASTAATKAEEASGSASTASTQAGIAATKAGEAATSAQTATDKAAEAAGYAALLQNQVADFGTLDEVVSGEDDWGTL